MTKSDSKGANLQYNLKYENQLEEFIEKNNIDKSDFFLAGSVCLDIRGLRNQRDIDICPNEDNKELFKQMDMPDGFDYHEQRYEEFNISNDEILDDENYYDVVQGYRIVRPELKFSKALARMRTKDRMDVTLLENYAFNNPNDWDWDLVIFEAYENEDQRSVPELAFDLILSLKERGILSTTKRVVDYMDDNIMSIPKINDNIVVNKARYPIERYNIGGLATRDRVIMCCGMDELLSAQFIRGQFGRMDIILDLAILHNDFSVDENTYYPNICNSEIKLGPGRPVEVSDGFKIINKKQLVILMQDNQQYIPIRFCDQSDPMVRDIDWLQSIGIDDNKIDFLNKKLINLLDEYGLLFHIIVWPAANGFFEEIDEEIRHSLDVVDSEEIQINDFEEFVRRIYSAQHGKRSWKIERKIQELSKYKRSIWHYKINPPRKAGGDEAARINKIKEEIRDKYRPRLNNNYDSIVIHSTDTYSENRQVSSILQKYNSDTS